jgi:hypothetical protein
LLRPPSSKRRWPGCHPNRLTPSKAVNRLPSRCRAVNLRLSIRCREAMGCQQWRRPPTPTPSLQAYRSTTITGCSKNRPKRWRASRCSAIRTSSRHGRHARSSSRKKRAHRSIGTRRRAACS